MGKKEIKLCKDFIKDFCNITKNISYNNSSYGFKHIVERWAGIYISNDDFIDACLELGLKQEESQKIFNDTNIKYNCYRYFNIKIIRKKVLSIKDKYGIKNDY